jgi:peptidoglycan-associated lipoprotein
MRYFSTLIGLVVAVTVAACSTRQAPATSAAPPPPAASPVEAVQLPPQPVQDIAPVPVEPRLTEDGITARSLDELNRNSPFQPVLFPLDSSDMDDAGRRVASANAEIMKSNPSWIVTIEGHCDERGTAEYNLALGERRAVAVRAYLLSLGVSPERVRTVSYGKEFPFDSGHNEEAWTKNRRAHFVVASR